ncbi:peroxidase-related enzyme [bacterium]|nr:peroxidase-related enzyme [bacterium]
MPFIKIISQEDAGPLLSAIYKGVSGERGRVSNVLMIQSLDPPSLKGHLDLYKAVMFSREGLSRREREVAAVAVSVANRCPYCVAHHGAALRTLAPLELSEGLENGALPDDLTPRELAIVAFAKEQTSAPVADLSLVEELRKVGLDDLEVLQVAEVVAYFNFVNRIVLSLGVSLDGDAGVEGYRYD